MLSHLSAHFIWFYLSYCNGIIDLPHFMLLVFFKSPFPEPLISNGLLMPKDCSSFVLNPAMIDPSWRTREAERLIEWKREKKRD